MTFQIKQKSFAPFPHLNGFLDDNDFQINNDIIEVMQYHVSILCEENSCYFPNSQKFDKLYRLINTPFGLKLDDLPSTNNQIQEQLIYHQQTIKFKSDMVNDGIAKNFYREMCCSDFCKEMIQIYPDLANMALKVFIPFATTYK